MVVNKARRRRDALQEHYTSAAPIADYMASRLAAGTNDIVWEPCAGGGDLIDSVLRLSKPTRIVATEISSSAVKKLRKKYRDIKQVEAIEDDAIEYGAPSLFNEAPHFTRIIANPPYGAYLTPARRKQLQQRYPNAYVKETYGLFLHHALSLLAPSGKLVFIIPDTFLWLNRHEQLRKELFRQNRVDEIALFPSKFFPNVNFGYSGLCIITVTRAAASSQHAIRVVDELRTVDDLAELSVAKRSDWPGRVTEVPHSMVADHEACCMPTPDSLNSPITPSAATKTVDSVACVKTGFYSGNDRHWIRKRSLDVPRSKAYKAVEKALVATKQPSLTGFTGKQCFIPIVRGGARPYTKPTNWYVDWSADAIAEYRRSGKNPARFQNSSFYFRDGVGVPMVASGRLSGALLENRLFDQGIVAVFPNDPGHLLYLLGFFNSSIATDLLRHINPTANNSANYIKRLPFVQPTARQLASCNQLVQRAIEESASQLGVPDGIQSEIDAMYYSIWAS